MKPVNLGLAIEVLILVLLLDLRNVFGMAMPNLLSKDDLISVTPRLHWTGEDLGDTLIGSQG